MLKAVPLAGHDRLAELKKRLATFPPQLGRAMVLHGLATPTPWKAITQIIHRDATLWCREIQVDACYRLLLVLCGVNGQYFSRFQVKRMARLAAKLALSPSALAERIERLMQSPPREAFNQLHALEGEVLAIVAERLPEIELSALRQRRAAYAL